MCVVGASDRAGSVGATVWRNLRAARFAATRRPVMKTLARWFVQGLIVLLPLAKLLIYDDTLESFDALDTALAERSAATP